MKKIILSILFLNLFLYVNAQQSWNIALQATVDDNSIPVVNGVSYNDIWGYVDGNGREYAILGSTKYTHFFDVTNPQVPIEVDRVEGKGNTNWRDFKTYGHYAYGVADDHRGTLQIFDLSDLPNSVTLVYDKQDFFSNCHNIYIEEATGRLYAVGSGIADIVVLDLTTNPANPTLLKNINLNEGYVHDLYVRNGIAFSSHVYESSLFVYDLSDVNNVMTLGSLTNYTAPGLNHSSWLSEDGTILTLADETKNSPVKIIDVSDLTDMNEISTFKSTLEENETGNPTNSIAHNSFIVGNNFVVLSYYHEGVQIYDISDPQNPVRAGFYDTEPANTNYSGSIGCWGVYPYLPSGNILASDVRHGLFVLKPNFSMVDTDCIEDIVYEEIVTDGQTLTLEAKNSISLVADFHAQEGSNFSAVIIDCVLENIGEEEAGKTALNELLFEKNSKPNLELTNFTQNTLSIYPNPFTTQFKVVLENNWEDKGMTIQLIDQLGKIIQPMVLSCGIDCFTIETNDLNNGIYTLFLQSRDGKNRAQKIVKME